MNANDILAGEEFKRCENFHGHVCPGLSIGYRAARIGLKQLSEQRARDEEIAAVVETDACCVDAIQVITGCTFGKGNFIYKDNGKMAFTFFSRSSGKGIRVSMRPGALAPDEEHMDLLAKTMAGEATEEMQARFRQLHHQRSCDVLEMPEEELFTITEVTLPPPAKARIEPSKTCDRCGEPTMASKLIVAGDGRQCRECANL